jgi:peptidoglycan-associated lipoprotein
MRYVSRVMLAAALASGPIVAGCTSRPALAKTLASAFTDAKSRVVVLAQAGAPAAVPAPAAVVAPAPAAPVAQPAPVSSLPAALVAPAPAAPVAQAPAAPVSPPPTAPVSPPPTAPVSPPPAAPVTSARTLETPIGLPRVRDYEAIPDLRDIHFDFGLAVIRPDDARILDANAAWLRANPDQLVLIEGHCDDRGLTSKKNEFNMALGERRAQAAMNHLIAQGVQASRITILTYGEERPLCTGQSERCWSRNRRSRFLVKPR